MIRTGNIARLLVWTISIVLLILTACNNDENNNYVSNFEKSDKGTYGTKYTYALLEDIFDTLNYTRNAISDNFEHDYSTYIQNTWMKNIIFITNKFDTQDHELTLLMDHVFEGNQVIIASEYFDYSFKEELKIEIAESKNDKTDILEDQKISMTLINGPQTNLNFSIESYFEPTYFESFPIENTKVLGRLENGKPNIIQYQHGKGFFILCTTPTMFTNYGILLNDNHIYAECLFSLLDKKTPLTWDEFYKPFAEGKRNDEFSEGPNGGDGSNQNNRRPETKSDFDFLLRNPSLRWAFFLILVTATLLVLIGAKRRQRIIPPKDKKENSSKEFVKIISELYFQRGDHMDAAKKIISYFLEYIRESFYVKTNDLQAEDFLNKIANRSGIDTHEIKETFSLIEKCKNKTQFSENDLLILNKTIQEFKNKSLV